MAEVKNDFLKSKMNKDLDDRLVPKGEYRHAQNISVAKSEGNDVGALENILGNISVADFLTVTGEDEIHGAEIIGHFMDVRNDRIIVFITNYVDISGDNLSNFSPSGAYHAIGVYDILTNSNSIVVSGRFLNFSKTHEIYNVDMIENLLYWTDNRNQPRKINLSRANGSYYTTEDTISVSKYYPHQTIELLEEEVISGVLTNPGIGYRVSTDDLETRAIAPSIGVGLTVNVTNTVTWLRKIDTFTISNAGHGYKDGDVVKVNRTSRFGGGGDAEITLTTEMMSTMRDVISEKLPDDLTDNPYRQPYGSGAITWKGDPEYLKDKFVRFSYRFKFDDGEYSLIAPFTQTCFVPKQDGYFIGDDDAKTFKSTEVDFMQNKINDIILLINSPTGNWNDLIDTMKIVEVDIIYKEAGQNVVKVVDTIQSNEISSINSSILRYNYKSTKPWKTLPSSEILRVHDQVPLRAFTQELIGDRLIYGNYVDKPTPPASINYSLSTAEKILNTQKEYQNQNLKQNRSYQVGIVLSDRYGRQSTVILSSLDDNNVGSDIKGSTIFHEYKQSPFSDNGAGLFDGSDVWDGDACNVTFWDLITSGINTNSLWVPNYENGEPGLYNAVTNPLGWYSYKLVVKQTEQDYYNVYFPGILNGYADGDGFSTAATADEPVCHFVLQGDNINKIPRDLTLVGPTQTTFRTGRPSVQEDPSYYQFVDTSGEQFTVDPFSEEGERLLKERDREKDLDSGSQITNSSVKLSLRLNNAAPNTLDAKFTTTHQAYPGTSLDLVSTIGTGTELGLWDPSSPSPYNTCHGFYGYKDNPYIAKVNVSAPTTTGLTGPHPLSGKLNFNINSASTGDGYMPGSKNLLCTIPVQAPYGSVGQGFRVNVDGTTGNTGLGPGPADYVSIADPGQGWSTLMPPSVAAIAGCKISGGGTVDETFTLSWDKTLFAGNMAPSLAVYETEPLKSKLDIYWETSTNGLIEELNDLILSGNVETPVRVAGTGGNDIFYHQTEADPIGEMVSGPIYPYNSGGTPTRLNSVTLVSVTDRLQQNRTSEFDVELGANGITDGFKIKTNSYFMCDRGNSIFNRFTFVVEVEVPGAIAPNVITRQFTLGPYSLTNVAPSIITVPSKGNFLANTPINSQTGNDKFTFRGEWVSWNENHPPYSTLQVSHSNEVSDYQNVFNGEFFTCNEAGNYNFFYQGDFVGYAVCDFDGAPVEDVNQIGAVKGELVMQKKSGGIGSWVDIPGISTNLSFNLDTWDSNSDKDGHYGRSVDDLVIDGSNSAGDYGYLNNDNITNSFHIGVKYLSANLSLSLNDEIRIIFKGFYSSIYERKLIYTNNPFYYFTQMDPRFGRVFASVDGDLADKLGGLYIGNPKNYYNGTAYVVSKGGVFTANGLRANKSGGTIFQFEAENGAFVGSGLETESITWTLIDPTTGTTPTKLYLTPVAGVDGKVDLKNSPGGSSGSVLDFTIVAKDGAGMTNSFTSSVLLL